MGVISIDYPKPQARRRTAAAIGSYAEYAAAPEAKLAAEPRR